MTIEEEVLYYLKRSSNLPAANREYNCDPNFEERYKAMREVITLLLDVVESKSKGEHKYDFVDYNSENMQLLKEKLKKLAEDFENIVGDFN